MMKATELIEILEGIIAESGDGYITILVNGCIAKSPVNVYADKEIEDIIIETEY